MRCVLFGCSQAPNTELVQTMEASLLGTLNPADALRVKRAQAGLPTPAGGAAAPVLGLGDCCTSAHDVGFGGGDSAFAGARPSNATSVNTLKRRRKRDEVRSGESAPRRPRRMEAGAAAAAAPAAAAAAGPGSAAAAAVATVGAGGFGNGVSGALFG